MSSYYGMPLYVLANPASHPSEEEDKSIMPWERDDFVPRTASGKQKTPNQIRNELQRYIDASPETQTAIVGHLGVNYASFSKFMNPKTYKNQWSATQNGTYWAAARFLEREKYESKVAGKKRKAVDGTENGASKKSASVSKNEAELLMLRIQQVELPANSPVYDSCPELVKKIKDFLKGDGVTKAAFCRALGGINSNSLGTFLMGKNQDQCGNITYQRAYRFFERKRILDGESKSNRRLKNEAEHPGGFSLEKERPMKWVVGLRF